MKRRFSNRLSFENLERREMMAADAVLANGVLNITGTDQADRIVVSQVISPIGLMTVKVTIHDIATGNQLINRSFADSSVRSVKVESLAVTMWPRTTPTSRPPCTATTAPTGSSAGRR